MEDKFSQIICNLVFECPMGARNLANAIGKPYSTLLREINPYDSGAKLGAETLIKIMITTNNIEPLEYIAKKMNIASLATNGFLQEEKDG